MGHVRERRKKTTREQEQAHRRRLGIKRWSQWGNTVEAWLRSDLPPPNYHLVVHLGRGEVHQPISAAEELQGHLDEIRRRVVALGGPWLAAWVIELRHGIHAHVLLHLPADRNFLEGLAGWLMTRFKMVKKTRRSPIFTLQAGGTGQPAHLGVICQTKCYAGTGRAGAEGLGDYLGKSIVEDCRPSSRGRRLGRQVGASRSVSRLARRPIEN